MPVATVHRTTRTPVSAVVLLLALGLAATGSSSAAGASHRVTSKPADAGAATLTPKTLVRQIGLVNSDFTDGSTVVKIRHGNRVHGQVTLDACGFNFTTESRRVARHQTVVLPTSPHRYLASNEVVAYQSRHFAGKALRQLRRAITHCPKHVYFPSAIAGNPDYRFDVAKLRSSPLLPVTDNAIVTLKIGIKGQRKPVWALLIFQRRGTVLDGMYKAYGRKLTPTKVAALRSLAKITGARLAASTEV
jgi:hypothetical protein